jgi:predicted nucleotidyltransferase
MIFRDALTGMLGSRVKSKLVPLLLDGTLNASERELAARIGASHVAVNKAMKDLQQYNLVSPERIGNGLVWRVNRDSYAYDLLARLTRLPPARQDLVRWIADRLKGMPIQQAVLYGSVAEGQEQAHSDVDLYLQAKNGSSDRIRKALEHEALAFQLRYGNSLSLYIVEEDGQDRVPRPVREQIQRGIGVVLHGT